MIAQVLPKVIVNPIKVNLWAPRGVVFRICTGFAAVDQDAPLWAQVHGNGLGKAERLGEILRGGGGGPCSLLDAALANGVKR